jgi:hypothetical protein
LFQQLFRFFQTRCNPPGQGQGVKKIIHQLIIYLKSRFSKFLHWLLWIFENAYKFYIFYFKMFLHSDSNLSLYRK